MKQHRHYQRNTRIKSYQRPRYASDYARKMEERKFMPYWANYLLRTFIVLFLLLAFYLFGICNPKGQKQIKDYVKSEFYRNASLTEAYQTYKDVDYEDMMKQLSTYVKAKLN